MKIPCKICIALAACVAKNTIKCEIIYEILRKEVVVNPEKTCLGKICKETRKQINEIFPNVRYISRPSNGNPRLTFKGFK